jgi:hypothetical protein
VHTAGLQLQKRAADEWSSNFTMTFGIPLSLSKNEGQKKLFPRRSVLIIMEESKGNAAFVPQRPNPSPIQSSYLEQLRTDFKSKSSPQLTTVTLPPQSKTSSSSSSSSLFTNFRSIFKKSDSNLTSSSISASSGMENFPENHHSQYVQITPE